MNIDGSNKEVLVGNHPGWINAVDYHYRYASYSAIHIVLYYIGFQVTQRMHFSQYHIHCTTGFLEAMV